MSQDSRERRMEADLVGRPDRPFGDTDLVSNTSRAPFSRAGMDAADNLLAKAERALAADDPQRTRGFVERAAALAYDEHEGTPPGGFAAGMLLFDAVADALELSARGDQRWLDAATTALASASEWGRSELRHTLLALSADYDLARGERRAIRDVAAAAPERVPLRDTRLPASELVVAIESVLRTVRDYRAAIEAPGRPTAG